MQLLSVTQGQAEFVGATCIHEENVQKAEIARTTYEYLCSDVFENTVLVDCSSSRSPLGMV